MKNPNKKHCLVRRLLRDESGVQLVEAAIVLPILLVLLAATAEFGRFFYTYTALAKATRAGSRYISAQPYNATYKANAKNLVVCGKTSACGAGDTKTVQNLTVSQVEITESPVGACVPDTITVALKIGTGGYKYQTIFGLDALVGGGADLNIDVKPSTTMQYLLKSCFSAPAP